MILCRAASCLMVPSCLKGGVRGVHVSIEKCHRSAMSPLTRDVCLPASVHCPLDLKKASERQATATFLTFILGVEYSAG